MKLYAMQMPVENQESPFDTYGKDDLYEDAIIVGNDGFNSYTTKEYDMLVANYEWIYDEYHAEDKYKEYESFEKALNSIMPKTSKELYSEREIKRWEWILNKHDDIYNMDKVQVAECLYMITDMEYHYQTIRGSIQSEWQGVFYTKHIDIDKLEADYFNLGTEWICTYFDDEIDDISDLPCDYDFMVYCYGYNEKIIIEEIAEYEGIEPEDVILYKYDGYIQIPKYSRV